MNPTNSAEVSKLVKLWENKNAQRALRGAGLSTMALSLAACGGSDTTTTTTTPTTPTAVSKVFTSAIDTLEGAGANDTFTGDTATVSAADTVTAGDGTDIVKIFSSSEGAIAVPQMTGVETLYISVADDEDGTGNTLDLDGVAVTRVTLASLDDNFAVTNASTADVIEISDNAGATVDVSLTYASVTGTADAATVEVDQFDATSDLTIADGLETLTISSTGSTASAIAALDHGSTVTTLNLAATGSALTITEVDAGADNSITSIVVTGTKAVTVTNAMGTGVTSINASGNSGGVTMTAADLAAEATNPGTVDIVDLTITGGSGADDFDVSAVATGNEISVSTGAGNDTVTVGSTLTASSTTSAGDVVDGGAGTDTLESDDATLADFTTTNSAGVSNFEILKTSDALDESLTTANVQAGITTVTIAGSGTSDNGAIVFEAGAHTVNLTSSMTGTLTLSDTGTATTDSVTINNTATAADDMGDAEALVVNGIETVNIVSTAVGATSQDFGAITMTSDTGGTDTLNFSGEDRVTVGIITADVVNASGLSAQGTGWTFDMSTNALVGTTTNTITGSAGNDRLVGDADDTTTINGGAGDDTITGGSDSDTLNGGTGADTITIGAGSDTVDAGDGDDTVILAAAGDLSSGDTITGGVGTDELSLVEAVTATEANGVSGFETLTFADGASQDMAVFANNTTFTTVKQTNVAAADDLTLTNVAAGLTTLNLLDDDGNLNVSLTRLVDGSTNALTILGSAAGATDYDAITVNNEETLTLTSGDATAETLTIATLNASDLTSLTLTGTGAITVTDAIVGSTSLATVDASAMTAAADIDATNSTVAVTMTGGTAGDTLEGGAGDDTITGGAGDDTLIGNAGADTISGGDGADTITGGAGHDTITAGAGGGSIDGGSGNDTITGGSGADTITGGLGNDTIDLGSDTAADVINIDGEFGSDVLTNFDATAEDKLDFTTVGVDGVDGLLTAISVADEEIVVVVETTSNDTVAEIDALYEALDHGADADGDTVAAYTQLYVTYSADDKSVATIYKAVGDGNEDDGANVTITELGTLDLGSVTWDVLTVADFTAA